MTNFSCSIQLNELDWREYWAKRSDIWWRVLFGAVHVCMKRTAGFRPTANYSLYESRGNNECVRIRSQCVRVDLTRFFTRMRAPFACVGVWAHAHAANTVNVASSSPFWSNKSAHPRLILWTEKANTSRLMNAIQTFFASDSDIRYSSKINCNCKCKKTPGRTHFRI